MIEFTEVLIKANGNFIDIVQLLATKYGGEATKYGGTIYGIH